jgi:hypothetical protein
MTPRAARLDLDHMRGTVGWIALGVTIGLTGCVAQSTYDKQVAETATIRETLAQAQAETAELLAQVQELQASNRELDNTTETVRAAIQHEEEATAALRQRAQDKLAALQTQLASLINQRRIVARDIADAKQQNASLRASVAQLKHDLEERQAAATQVLPMPTTPGALESGAAGTPMQSPPPGQSASPQEATQASPPTATQPPVSPAPPAESAPADESWAGWLMSWLSSLWSWIFN